MRRAKIAVLSLTALALAGGAVLVGVGVYRTFDPCTDHELDFARGLAEDMRTHLDAVSSAEVRTSDCDSGSLPVVEIGCTDDTLCAREVDARYACTSAASGDDDRTCTFEGSTFMIWSHRAMRQVA